MSVNKFKPHLFVIPEDRANEQIANGFARSLDNSQMQVVDPAGGWMKAIETFADEYEVLLRNNQNTHVALVIDFDDRYEERRSFCDSEISEDVRERVFIVGAKSDPEALKRSLHKNYESIGLGLADDCCSDRMEYWGHEQLMHNENDRLRLVQVVKPFLFS